MDWINGGFYLGFILVINQLPVWTSGMDWIYGGALVGHLDCRWVPLRQGDTPLSFELIVTGELGFLTKYILLFRHLY